MPLGLFGKKPDKEPDKPRGSVSKRGGATDQYADLPEVNLDNIELEAPAADNAADASVSAPHRPTSIRTRSGKGTPLGELLVRSEVITQEQLDAALTEQQTTGIMLGRVLVAKGFCTEADIASALGKQFRVHTVELAEIAIQDEAARMLDRDVCLRLRVIPFEKLGGTLCVAMANALARTAITEIEEISHLKVKPFAARWPDIQRAIDRILPASGAPAAAPAAAKTADAAAEAPIAETPPAPAAPRRATEPIKVAHAEPPAARAPEPEAVPEPEPEPAPEPESSVDLTALDEEAEVVHSDKRGLRIDESRRLKPEPEPEEEDEEEEEEKPVAVDLGAFDPDTEGDTVTQVKVDKTDQPGAQWPAAPEKGAEEFVQLISTGDAEVAAMGYDLAKLASAELVAADKSEYLRRFEPPVAPPPKEKEKAPEPAFMAPVPVAPAPEAQPPAPIAPPAPEPPAAEEVEEKEAAPEPEPDIEPEPVIEPEPELEPEPEPVVETPPPAPEPIRPPAPDVKPAPAAAWSPPPAPVRTEKPAPAFGTFRPAAFSEAGWTHTAPQVPRPPAPAAPAAAQTRPAPVLQMPAPRTPILQMPAPRAPVAPPPPPRPAPVAAVPIAKEEEEVLDELGTFDPETIVSEPAFVEKAPAHPGAWAPEDFEDDFSPDWSLAIGKAVAPVALAEGRFKTLTPHMDQDQTQEWRDLYCSAGPIKAVPMQKES
jgi:hypothetical protein